MNNILVLLNGDLQRIKKYNILAASFFVALIWIGVLHLSEVRDVTALFPVFIFFDATSVSMLLIGVTIFFEKQEGTLKTLLVSPISKAEYILAKTVASIVINMVTLVVIYLYAAIFKEININITGLLLAVILVVFSHSLLGLLLTYYSKDFTELLMGMMKYSIVFMMPVLLQFGGLIRNEMLNRLIYAIPTKPALLT
jgi:fluoroquinolone transport system permease protein